MLHAGFHAQANLHICETIFGHQWPPCYKETYYEISLIWSRFYSSFYLYFYLMKNWLKALTMNCFHALGSSSLSEFSPSNIHVTVYTYIPQTNVSADLEDKWFNFKVCMGIKWEGCRKCAPIKKTCFIYIYFCVCVYKMKTIPAPPLIIHSESSDIGWHLTTQWNLLGFSWSWVSEETFRYCMLK